jgi:uncharacterized membrane-anchored protein YitT (DUF2179 family)
MRWRRFYSTLRDYAQLTLGAVLVAVAADLFFIPNDVVAGGLVGIAQLLRTMIGTPVGIVSLVANIPLLFIGFRALGGFVFGIRTVYATVLSTVLIDVLAPYLQPFTSDPLLYTLYGGVLDGIGVGLVFRARGTTGGIDIIARLLEIRYGTRPGRAMLVINLFIYAGALFSYGPEKVLYAVLAAFIAGVALDYALAAGDGGRQALIVTAKPDAITQALLHDIGRGVTVIEGRGGYTGAERTVLLCVVARTEISPLKEIVRSNDPQAFVVIGEASEVLGEGFRQIT